MKKYLTAFLATFSVFGVLQLATPALVNAQFEESKKEACEGLAGDDSFIDCKNDDGAGTINRIITVALNILSVVAGVIAVIMLIIGGLKYITSQGDSQAAASARNTIIYAVVGIVIVVASQVIVNFVIDRATTEPVPAVDKSTPAEKNN